METAGDVARRVLARHPGISQNAAGALTYDVSQFGDSHDIAKKALKDAKADLQAELIAHGESPRTAEPGGYAPPIVSPTDPNADFLNLLDEINGQDAYSVEAEALGKLKADEYLRIPRGLIATAAKDVGKGIKVVNHNIFSQIYAYNKFEHIPDRYRVRFALLRAMAVSMGWYDEQRETTEVDMDDELSAVFLADQAIIVDELANARKFAFLTPFIAEYIFRTTGHHYLDSMARDYEDKYARLANACLAATLSSYLPPNLMYHEVLHWVSPARVRQVIEARGKDGGIPDAVLIRKNAAPAGTAVVTTTSAVLDAMAGSGVKAEFEQHGGFNLDKIQTAAQAIRESPTKFHKAHYAYGVPGLTAAEATMLDEAAKEAIKFAPYAKGFIAAMFGDAALGRARVLDKHAELDPVAKKRATALFRKVSKTVVNQVADLFVGKPGEEE